MASKNITQGGKTGGGEWIDVIRFRDWLQNDMEVLAMKNENMTAEVTREWENDPNCFLRMLNSPAQQRSRAARRQKDANRERFNNVLNAVAIGAAAFAVTLLVICFVL